MLLFAGLAERLGERLLVLEPGDGQALPRTVAQLRRALAARWPELEGRPFRVSVGRRYAQDDDPVASGDEIALIPPVSGG